ncbi:MULTISPECIES: hypothetical protein [unclassified Methylocystis]|uniref:hypothetical protein n=1 Tax=unclassified Methylocystis TaxID=2625913 RepID=UPI001FEDE053|nr:MULTISPECIES: hypothetical protein [unclassified Methylocystis]
MIVVGKKFTIFDNYGKCKSISDRSLGYFANDALNAGFPADAERWRNINEDTARSGRGERVVRGEFFWQKRSTPLSRAILSARSIVQMAKSELLGHGPVEFSQFEIGESGYWIERIRHASALDLEVL